MQETIGTIFQPHRLIIAELNPIGDRTGVEGDGGLVVVVIEDEEIIPFCYIVLVEGNGGPFLNLAEDLAE